VILFRGRGQTSSPAIHPEGRSYRRERALAAAMNGLETAIAFKQGAESKKFLETDAQRLADGVRKVGRVEET